MTAKTRKISVYLVMVVTPLGLATVGLAGHAIRPSRPHSAAAAQEIDAAYCDGFFLGKLDGYQGRKLRANISRWSTEKDRSSFTAGYEKGYQEALASGRAAHRN